MKEASLSARAVFFTPRPLTPQQEAAVKALHGDLVRIVVTDQSEIDDIVDELASGADDQ